MMLLNLLRCRVCGCTDDDCSGCVERTGEPCHWIEPDLCSACAEPNAIDTTHHLDFLAGEYRSELADTVRELLALNGIEMPALDVGPPWKTFGIGTVDGLWRAVPGYFEILSIINSEKGNGHLDDVFEWFEFACRRDGKALRIREIMNERFRVHLVEKRGFVMENDVDAVKRFDVGEEL